MGVPYRLVSTDEHLISLGGLDGLTTQISHTPYGGFMTGERVRLDGEKATLLATLYGRALDARSPDPILGDTMAVRAVERIDHDFTQIGMDRRKARAVAFRARFLDGWAAEFLAGRPRAVVLHLGCGLDTRVWRLDPPPSVAWFDVDYPEVAGLRRRLFPGRPGLTTAGAQVTEPGWLDQVPTGRPVLVIAEGLVYYLDETGGRDLFRRIADRFPEGQFVFDALSRLGLRLQVLNSPVRKAGARMHWAVRGPRDLESIHPRLRCRDAISAVDLPGIDRQDVVVRATARLMRAVPGLRRAAVLYRLEF